MCKSKQHQFLKNPPENSSLKMHFQILLYLYISECIKRKKMIIIIIIKKGKTRTLLGMMNLRGYVEKHLVTVDFPPTFSTTNFPVCVSILPLSLSLSVLPLSTFLLAFKSLIQLGRADRARPNTRVLNYISSIFIFFKIVYSNR